MRTLTALWTLTLVLAGCSGGDGEPAGPTPLEREIGGFADTMERLHPDLFHDVSRSGARRWCSMQRCGNRHKVRQHRARAGTA